jgi:serine/threonine-protein kinase
MAVPFGKYQLLRKIASGGMGQVFLALEKGAGFERLVVLKLILPHLTEDDEFLSMFEEEARLVFRLSHPNLIKNFELTEIDGRHSLVMEYVQGEDVRRLDKFARAQGKPLPVGLVLRIIAEAAAGLDYAHQVRDAQGQPLKLVHRDVSPQNILVGFDGGVKVIDFGVAKAAGSTHNTATGVLKGKYPYMSPEQATGQPIDGRSDQFALGVVLWELLTSRRLFKGESDMMTLRLVRDCQVPRPSQLNPKLPPGIDELVLKALAPTPEARYPSCGAFRLAIEDYILQYRLPASNGHLSAFLHELYAERIAREADPKKLDQLADETDLDAMDSRSSSSRSLRSHSEQQAGSASGRSAPGSGRSSASKVRTPSVKGLAPAPTRQTVSLAQPAPPPRRFPVVPVAVVVGGLLVSAGVAFVLMRPAGPLPQPVVRGPTPPPTPVKEPSPVEQPPPTVAQPVTLQVSTEPAGAAIEVDGQVLGQTPYTLTLKPDAPPVTLALSLTGYEPISQQVSADQAPGLSVKLTPKRKTPRRNGIKTGR